MVLKIDGMGCMRCVARVRKALEEIGADVISCEIGSCEIKGIDDIDRIRESIQNAGFKLLTVES